MKKIFLLAITVGFAINSVGQNTKAENINVNIENNKIFVSYDLIGKDTLNKHNVELFFVDDRYSVFAPKKISGDYGKSVNTGSNKKIEWDVFTDDITIAQDLQAKIIVNGIKKGGPTNALYSFLIPGLGDYFVKDSRDMIIKPYMRTIATLGTVGLGIFALREREQVPLMSTKFVNELYDSNGDGKVNWYDDRRLVEKEIVIGSETKNWLFNNDAELFLIAGITMWVADIIWVFAKGTENEKLKMFSNFSFNASVNKDITNFGLTYKF